MPVSLGAAEDAPHDEEASRQPDPHDEEGGAAFGHIGGGGVTGGSGCAGRKLGAGISRRAAGGSSAAGRFRRLPWPAGGLGGAGGGRYAPAAVVVFVVGG